MSFIDTFLGKSCPVFSLNSLANVSHFSLLVASTEVVLVLALLLKNCLTLFGVLTIYGALRSVSYALVPTCSLALPGSVLTILFIEDANFLLFKNRFVPAAV